MLADGSLFRALAAAFLSFSTITLRPPMPSANIDRSLLQRDPLFFIMPICRLCIATSHSLSPAPVLAFEASLRTPIRMTMGRFTTAKSRSGIVWVVNVTTEIQRAEHPESHIRGTKYSFQHAHLFLLRSPSLVRFDLCARIILADSMFQYS